MQKVLYAHYSCNSLHQLCLKKPWQPLLALYVGFILVMGHMVPKGHVTSSALLCAGAEALEQRNLLVNVCEIWATTQKYGCTIYKRKLPIY